ncbi:esterase family protein [Dietzia aerolata]|uniref:Alpha/beta hydrolase n=1 Tax=Dietzia aerolata TaxID=595984 RepID=A0ABV5JNK3_9ACTN|nr:alpha/beta hydrolase family protein [Dietzia aerolata]MBB0968194.1 esterase family protein [Dietzia aerolata]
MRSVKRFGTKVGAVVAATAMVPVVATGTAQAQQSGTINYTKATATDKVVETPLNDGRMIVSVWSDAMHQEVPNIVQRPRDGNESAPVLYLVNGAGGGEDSATWQAQSNVKDFMADKDAWTVTPIGGAFSYYTDWQRPDPNVQTRYASDTHPMMFETYLAKELPDLFESTYGRNTGTDRKRGLAAISMTATSVLTIAQKYPGRFQAIGSYSGCAETSTPIGHEFINIVTGLRGGANLDNMWGPFPGVPETGTNSWFDNDPVWGAFRFKEQMDRGEQLPAMFISTGNGLPGPHESLENWRLKNSVPALANQAIVGGVIEAATQYCTANLARRFGELGIPAHFDFAPNGTHSWGYWEDDLAQSWPMMADAMNARYGPI